MTKKEFFLVRVLFRKYFLYDFGFRKKKMTGLCGGYLSAEWNCKFKLFESCPPDTEVSCGTISFSFCFLGTPPRQGELPAFCDLQFLNYSQEKLDLGTVERRGTIFKLVWGRGRSFFLCLLIAQSLWVLLYQDPWRLWDYRNGKKTCDKSAY